MARRDEGEGESSHRLFDRGEPPPPIAAAPDAGGSCRGLLRLLQP